MPANSAPPTAPMPPTTVSANTWRLLTRSKLPGLDRWELLRVQRAAEPGDAGRDREHGELRAEQVHAERGAGRLAVLHRDAAAGRAGRAGSRRRASATSANATAPMTICDPGSV